MGKKKKSEIVPAVTKTALDLIAELDAKGLDPSIQKLKADCLMVVANKAHSDQIAGILSKATPRDRVSYFPSDAGEMAGLAYVQDDYMMEILTEAFGINGWKFSFSPSDPSDLNWEFIKTTGWVIVAGKLEVLTPAGWSSRSQFGTKSIQFSREAKKMLSPAVAFKGAVSDAFKKCASMFGICNDVYTGKFNQSGESKKREQAAKDFGAENARKRMMMALRKLGWYTESDRKKAREYLVSFFPNKEWEKASPSTKDLSEEEVYEVMLDLEKKLKESGKDQPANGDRQPEPVEEAAE